MAKNMKDNLKMECSTERENAHGLMANSMKEITSTMKNKEMASINGLTETDTMENGKLASNTVKAP